jgi:flagellar export protein FliJ
MKPFRFSLESLRVLRQQKERAAQQRYARALDACNAAAAQLEDAGRALRTGWELLSRELANGISAGKIMSLRTWCMVLEIHQHERKAALAEARRIAELALQETVAMTREREGLDRFHGKARRAHAQEVLREEQKNCDELAVQLNGASGRLQFAKHENFD